MTTSTGGKTSHEPNLWAVGASVFAGVMMMTVGVLQFFQGLVAAVDGRKFVVTSPNYAFQFNLTAWGWIHIVLGVLVAAAGFFILTGNVVARAVGVALAVLSAIANFLWLPYYPIWSIVIIALNVVVIWGLTTSRVGDLGE